MKYTASQSFISEVKQGKSKLNWTVTFISEYENMRFTLHFQQPIIADR